MQIDNEFRLTASVEEAFALLTDIERIAPCMPGAELREIEGDEFRGIIKVKVGPISAQYKGAARLVSSDSLAGRAVLEAEGRETRGQGSARATITANFEPEAGKTLVKLTTELNITGKVAQMGRGVLGDVSAKLLRDFAECLELSEVDPSDDAVEDAVDAVDAPESEPEALVDAASVKTVEAEESVPAAPTIRTIESRPAEPVNLVDAAGGSIAKRLAPVVGAAVLVVLVIRWRRKKAL